MKGQSQNATTSYMRSRLLTESDLDDPSITIHMFPVAFRTDRVFEATLTEWDAVTGIARQFARECGYESNPPIFGSSGRVWLVTTERRSRPYSLVCGAAEVDVVDDRPTVTWMWIHPNCRRNKIETDRDAAVLLWERLQVECGPIEVQLPMSKAMEAFILKRSHGV